MTDDLVVFLRARLDEDAQAAEAAGGTAWKWEQHYGDMCNDPTCEYGELATDDTVLMNVHAYDIRSPWQGAAHIERHHPARVLAEVESKRGLLAGILAEPHATLRPGGSTAIYCGADSGLGEPCECGRDVRVSEYVRLLAQPYTAHPDYREEWRP